MPNELNMSKSNFKEYMTEIGQPDQVKKVSEGRYDKH